MDFASTEMAKQLSDSSFDKLLKDAVDITATFDIDLGNIPEDILQATREARPFIKKARELMEQHRLEPEVDFAKISTGLIDMEVWAEKYREAVLSALKSGRVMAVDGTPLIQHRRFLTQQVYACAVGGLTSREPMALQARLVKVKADLQADDNLQRVMSESEALIQSQSWPTAFMEYQERAFAYQASAEYVIVDGVLVTQNLLTRAAGRQLYMNMFRDKGEKVYVGVAKNISGGDADQRYAARALRTGEMYVLETLQAFMLRREDAYTGRVQDFLNTIGVNILRGVYKPGQKTFGFECHRDDLGAVVALLWLDRNNVPGFEIPFLLAQVDAQLRGRYRPAETMAAVESQLVSAGEAEFFDETDERMYRS